MFKIKTLDKISQLGLTQFESTKYEVNGEIENPEVILVRSSKIESLPSGLLAIGRAGIGVNNIPVAECSKKGIVVFNTPGANANAVKELVLTAILLAKRDVVGGVNFLKNLSEEEKPNLEKVMEKNKSKFVGAEVRGKKLGIIGLGAIGMMIANDAVNLGMEVFGYDPYITVSHAWQLSREVKEVKNLDTLLSHVDYLSLNVPLTNDTRGLINSEKIKKFKKGLVLLNFARGDIVVEDDLLQGIEQGYISKYFTDFPTAKLLENSKVVGIPHLGASSFEAEENCAMMIVKQVKDFLENGNVKNSVNFPECSLDWSSNTRLIVANENIPNMVGQITAILAKYNFNIINMVNKSKGDFAYNILDLEGNFSVDLTSEIKKIPGVVAVNLILR